VTSALGMKGGMIEESAHFRVAAFTGENIQLFFRADEIAGKTKQLKEKGAALGVGGIDCRELRRLKPEWRRRGAPPETVVGLT